MVYQVLNKILVYLLPLCLCPFIAFMFVCEPLHSVSFFSCHSIFYLFFLTSSTSTGKASGFRCHCTLVRGDWETGSSDSIWLHCMKQLFSRLQLIKLG